CAHRTVGRRWRPWPGVTVDRAASRSSGSATGPVRGGGPSADDQERRRGHRQRDVPVPGPIAADLVVVQAGLGPRVVQAFLDGPPAARDLGQFRQGGPCGSETDVVLDLQVAVFMPDFGYHSYDCSSLRCSPIQAAICEREL